MSYLYGDSTPSTLEIDYIEFLRDAVDCSVQVLLAEQWIANGKTRIDALSKATATELEQIRKVAELVPKAFEGGALGDPESPAARCAAAIMRSAAATAAATAAEVQGLFDAAVSKAAVDETAKRRESSDALERLVIKHDLPGMKAEIQLVIVGAGNYVGRAYVSTGFGVSGTLLLEVPKDHLLERIMRVDRLVERLEVQAPEIGGWLHKEIKLRPQHLEKLHVAGASFFGVGGDTIRLRSAADGSGSGFDLSYSPNDGPIRLVRVGDDSKGDQKGDDLPFDVEDGDLPKLRVLREKLSAAARSLLRHRRSLGEAKLDGESLGSHPSPSLLVERLVTAMAPTVQEIAARSQSPGELVLRRAIGEARREEIFLSKSELMRALEPLTERNRSLFDPLWVVLPPGALPSQDAASAEPPTLRTIGAPDPSAAPDPSEVPTVRRTVVPDAPPEISTTRTGPPPPPPPPLPLPVTAAFAQPPGGDAPAVARLADKAHAPRREGDAASAPLASAEMEAAIIEERPSS